MASGMFPCSRDGDLGKKLLRAHDLIREVIDEVLDDVYGGTDGQYDNAADDGGSIALLGLAATLCQQEVRKEKPTP